MTTEKLNSNAPARPACACGCGQPVGTSWKAGRVSRYASIECQLRAADRRANARKVKARKAKRAADRAESTR